MSEIWNQAGHAVLELVNPGKTASLAHPWMGVAIVLLSLALSRTEPSAAALSSPGAPPTLPAAVESLPPVTEILQGRTFGSTFERDVFFLKRVHSSYPAFWSPLLS